MTQGVEVINNPDGTSRVAFSCEGCGLRLLSVSSQSPQSLSIPSKAMILLRCPHCNRWHEWSVVPIPQKPGGGT